MDLSRQLEELNNKIKNIDNELKQMKEKRKGRENAIELGVISIVDDKLKIDLLLNADDFSEEHIQRLTQIANDLQNLLLDVYKEVK